MTRMLIISNYSKIVPSRPEAEAMIQLHSKGVFLEIITLKNAAYTPIFREAGITVYETHPTKKRDLEARKFIRKKLIEGNFNILHCFNSKASLNGIPAAKGLPVKILLYRGFTGHLHWYDPTFYLKYGHPRVDGIWCIAKGVEELFHEQLFFKKSKTKVIHKGHHPDWYKDVIEKKLENEVELPDNALKLIIVANARKMKGIPDLYKMTYHLPKNLPIHLFVVGDGMDSKELNKIRMASPNVDKIHLLGYRKDAVSLVKNADIFILTSLFGEAITKAVIEAMSLGTMPLVTDIPGNRDLVLDKKSGRVVPVGDPKAMAKVVEELFHDRNQIKDLSIKTKAFITKEFHTSKTVTELKTWYQALIN